MTETIHVDRATTFTDQHHDMIRLVAKELVRKGFQVQADHVDWPDGPPMAAVDGYKPDILAFRESRVVFVQVETCSTYRKSKVGHPLSVFSQKGAAWVVIPTACGKKSNPVLYMRDALRDWALTNVKIGTCDLLSGKVELPKE
ncbi:hypothetical protein [Desmospora profundinema]|uniref:Uncharacterized protein n=1 Tax=Desmospora profundinema TaxID=1571184 RepID=A0ABU1IQZ2_9BACL|nr:hypothetical protein [Desmospora profundinema]MDR6227221.1 hypothetical protein [Desmospora profundinema]